MAEGDLFKTRRDPGIALAVELAAAGFDDAEEIGRGGFGTVYRCTQRDLDRTVAVKVLSADLDEQNRARFEREQRAMGRLTGHPNIVGILEVGHTRTGRPYLVMPYHPQGSLDTRIRDDGPLPLDEALRLGIALADALDAMHRLDIVHRDIKPANVLYTTFDEPALADFGIAHISGAFRTEAGTVTGSPAYTAPEVLGGEPPSTASDIYGLGATLFAALTGHAAFERHSGEQVVAQFLRITTQPVPDLRERGVPDEVCAAIERAMARDPRQRPTAAALAHQLRHIADGGPTHRAGAAPSSTRPELPLGIAAPLSTHAELPTELTSFIGRRDELAEIRSALATGRLVTLAGIGGVGKTRLALRAAAAVRDSFPDGVWLVELGEVRDPAVVVDVVASVLGVRDYAGRSLREVLVKTLSPRTGLLVLDNCEQVIDAVADLVRVLLARCPHVGILATSREPLGLGEPVIRIEPLTTPPQGRSSSPRDLARSDAVALFAERAASAVPGFALTDANTATIAQICERLDGLPLAIELAAARLRALSPEQLLDRLGDRYRLLSSSGRGVPPRQQTLRWSIGWSYELCTPVERRLWNELSLFAGSFELDDAENVCGDTEDLLDTLTSLVDKSILVREEVEGAVRFRMLDTVREYGREQVESGGAFTDLQRLHRDWYRKLAVDAEAGWISPRQLDWNDRLCREMPNLRQALEFSLTQDDDSALTMAAALSPFWLARGLLTEGRRWLDRALDRPGPQPDELRARALHAVCMLAAFQGDVAATSTRGDDARILDTQDPNTPTHALLTLTDGISALLSGEFDHALSSLHDAEAGFRTLGRVRLQIAALLHLGWAYQVDGQTTQALAHHEQALDLTTSRGEYAYRTYALWSIAIEVWRTSDRDRAAELLREALRMTRRTEDPLMTFSCLQALAWVTATQGDSRTAAVIMASADGQRRLIGSNAVFLPNLLVHQREFEQTLHETLDGKSLEAARREGNSLGTDAAIALAIGEHVSKPDAPEDGPVKLTKRERQIAGLVAEGLTNRAIADRLVISQRTAEGHVEHILTKLGFTSRTQVAAWVVEHSPG